MVYKVNFSKRASNELTDILNYIEDKWSFKIVQEFTLLLNNKVSNIVTNPYLYSSYKNQTSIRRCVISEHVSLFYSIEKTEIKVLTLFDTRQNPNKLKI